MWPTKDEITEILVKSIVGKDKKFDRLSESWFVKHLIIALREGIWAMLLMVKMVYGNLTVKTSTGDDLDDKGYDFGVDRKQAVKALHSVTLHKSAEAAYDIFVPDGFLLSTTPVGSNPPMKFVVTPGQGKFIAKGQKSVSDVIVECTQLGTVGNVADGSINLVAQSGFDYVTDSVLFSAGNEKESDAPYKERILSRKRKPYRSGVPSDWEIWAMEVAGVTAARCFRGARGPGTADIVIWGEGSGVPEDGLLAECQKHFDKNYMPADLFDGGVLAVGPEEILVEVAISNVRLKNGYSKEDAKEILKNALLEFFKLNSYKSQVTMVDLIVCMRMASDPKDSLKSPVVEDFSLVLPDKNITLSGRQCLILSDLTIEVVEGE